MKTVQHSKTIQSHLILPPDTNHHGSIFGGTVLAYIDEMAAITSMKHAGYNTVTASIDSVDFLSPARVGDVLELESIVVYTGRTSITVFVRVTSFRVKTGERTLTTESFVTMVAVDENGQPQPVPPIVLETDEEKALHEQVKLRRELHAKHKKK
ncbi:acyl-CoA thioesterase [Lysinibacillus odysseyi]|uniref:Acyl-CoA hydrolase n=1 Tax=Lysinibacillus odysseyi 34hs-1 = NBRC 100172 TaxID=1220589 RepID=A0A0A3ITJ4_9BACI|nr:acyl-CoA thioesterase [Lysinibacillus odysseyi]KGR86193.1 acyl-CoA hydrolase [Lysinibacillus odysseyi 34hs-1 = NBRC 100172]